MNSHFVQATLPESCFFEHRSKRTTQFGKTASPNMQKLSKHINIRSSYNNLLSVFNLLHCAVTAEPKTAGQAELRFCVTDRYLNHLHDAWNRKIMIKFSPCICMQSLRARDDSCEPHIVVDVELACLRNGSNPQTCPTLSQVASKGSLHLPLSSISRANCRLTADFLFRARC